MHIQCFKSIYVVGLLVICASISTVNAINCYQCNSHNDPECLDLSAHKPHKVAGFYQPCEKDADGNEPFCRTISYKFKFLKNHDPEANRVIRTCGFQRSQRECYKADNDHHLELVCQCFDDGCNAATNLPIFSMVAVTFIAFALYYIN